MKRIQIITLLVLSLLLSSACSRNQADRDAEPEQPQETAKEGEIHWGEEKMKMAGITLGAPKKENMPVYIECTGMVEVPPKSHHSIHSPVRGYAQSVNQYQGQYVRKGAFLTSLTHPELIRLQRDYLESLERVDLLTKVYQRKKTLAEAEAGAQKDLESARSELRIEQVHARAMAAELRMIGIDPEKLEKEGEIRPSVSIVAPASGYLHKIYINPGKLVDPDQPLYDLVDPDHLHLDLKVYGEHISLLESGQHVKAFLAGRSDTAVGEILLVDPIVDPETGTASVHAHFDEGSYQPEPGTYLLARIRTGEREEWTLPTAAVIREGKEYFVFLEKDGRFHRKAVRVNGETNSLIAIEWDEEFADHRVVLEGAYYLAGAVEDPEHSH